MKPITRDELKRRMLQCGGISPDDAENAAVMELLDRVERLESVNEAAKEVLWGIYGGINNDDFVAEIAIDRAAGDRTRAVALYDAIVAAMPVPEESGVQARVEGEE